MIWKSAIEPSLAMEHSAWKYLAVWPQSQQINVDSSKRRTRRRNWEWREVSDRQVIFMHAYIAASVSATDADS